MLTIINAIALLIGVIGGLVAIYGVLQALLLIIKYASARHRPSEEGPQLDHIRLDLGRFIIIALEFFIAKDIIETLIVPSWSEVGMLAVVVVIRTILSFFLTKEVQDIEKRKIEHRKIDAGIR